MTIHQTAKGTRYLTAPRVEVLAHTKRVRARDHLPIISPGAFAFSNDFIEEMGFGDSYVGDALDNPLPPGTELAKFAGQLCYLSLGEQRTKNAQAQQYIDHIKASGHGSVLEHVSATVLLWGVSRALTHELVRHRVGFGFSQVSQRYIAGRHLRFVETPAYQQSAELHNLFADWIDASAEQYQIRESVLLNTMGIGYDTATTEQRKAVRQEARRCLPNETEAPIVVTANVRSWRHFIEQRCSPFADAEICRCAYAVYQALSPLEPMLWSDYTPGPVRPDGLPTLTTPYRKV
jgi:thymidylate synthase (FAD)